MREHELFKKVRSDPNYVGCGGSDPSWHRNRTFFFGLKLSQPNNSQIQHLYLYLSRRVVFAACLVFWQDHVNLGIGLLMASSLLMLAILWRDN